MATVPTPTTQTAGTVVAAATINSQGNLATYLAGRTESGGARRPLCVMRQTVAQSLTNNTATAITFDAEDVDYDNGHSTVTNTSRYTAGTAGWYLVNYAVAFSSNATGKRTANLKLNGTTDLVGTFSDAVPLTTGDVTTFGLAKLIFLNASDYIELMALQTSGGALNTYVTAPIQSMMSVEWRSV